MLAALVLKLSLSTSSLSVTRPLGSPTLPVAPPTCTMTSMCEEETVAASYRPQRWDAGRSVCSGEEPISSGDGLHAERRPWGRTRSTRRSPVGEEKRRL